MLRLFLNTRFQCVGYPDTTLIVQGHNKYAEGQTRMCWTRWARYSLRTRTHNRQLPDRLSRLADCNFITHMLFYQSY